MADPLSILQVAGAGVELAKTLYTYGKTVHDAEKEINAIATEVKFTSKVFEDLATGLQQHDTQALCSASLKVDACSTLEGCKIAFNQLDSAVQSSLKKSTRGRPSFSARAKWPLNKSKMAALQANLERLKTALSLMLDVLNLASKQASL